MRREGDDERIDPREGGMGDEGRGAADRIRQDEQRFRAMERARRARLVKALVAVGLLAILLVFIFSNDERVQVDFVLFDRPIRLIWVMFGCALVGGIVGFLIGRPGRQVFGRRKNDEEDKG